MRTSDGRPGSPLRIGRFARGLLHVGAAVAAFAVLADSAAARAIRVDDTLIRLELNVADDTVNDGSTGPLPLQSYELDMDGMPDYSAALPFSINLFGTSFSEFYINENGTVTFGAAFGGRPSTADLANTGMPVLAPFFADVDVSLGGRIFNGFFPFANSIAITWTAARYDGQAAGSTNDFQIVIRDRSALTGTAGDFDLEFNYIASAEGMAWETGNRDGGVNGLGGSSARVGFYDGFGVGYEVAGSGVPGALLTQACVSHPLALSCNDYFYQFRGGLPYQDGRLLIAVPVPGTLMLMLAALPLLLARARRPRRR